MRRRVPKRALTVLTSVLFVAGCTEANEVDGPERGATTVAPATGRTLSVEELEALTLPDEQVPASYTNPVVVVTPGGHSAHEPVSEASCETVLDTVRAEGARASVFQTFNWKGDIWGGNSTLATFGPGQAGATFDELSSALRECTSFVSDTYVGVSTFTVEVTQGPRYGDESVSFHIRTHVERGDIRDEEHTFVRVGLATAHFEKLFVGRDARFPPSLIRLQVERLRKGQGIRTT
jgi:hypothetical protein